MSDVTV